MQIELSQRARRAAARRAFTLMELLAVVAIMGLLVGMALPYFGHSTVANAGARGLARRLALDAVHARRLAISTGDNHYLGFTKDAGNVTEYSVFHRTGSGNVQVDVTRTVPSDVTVTTSADNFEFTFTGEALVSYTASVVAPDSSYSLTIAAATGRAAVN